MRSQLRTTNPFPRGHREVEEDLGRGTGVAPRASSPSGPTPTLTVGFSSTVGDVVPMTTMGQRGVTPLRTPTVGEGVEGGEESWSTRDREMSSGVYRGRGRVQVYETGDHGLPGTTSHPLTGLCRDSGVEVGSG